MADYFVKTATILRAPHDTNNDGRDAIGFNLTAATFTNSTKKLNETGAFTSYTFVAGDLIYIDGGTGVTTGLYEIAGRDSNDQIELVDDIGGTDPTDVTSSTGPFATIQQAMDTIADGDTIRICNDGDHTPPVTGIAPGTNTGSQSAPVIVTGTDARGLKNLGRTTRVKIDCSGQTSTNDGLALTGANMNSGSFTFLNLWIDNSPGDGVGCSGYSNHHLTFRQCRISNNTGYGVNAAVNSGLSMIDCELDNNGNYGFSGSSAFNGPHNILFCSIHGNSVGGIRVSDAFNGAVSFNEIYDNSGVGMTVITGGGTPRDNLLPITNNIFHNNDSGGVKINNSASSPFLLVFNNVFSENGTTGTVYGFEYGTNNIDKLFMDYNCFFGNHTDETDISSGTPGSNNVSSNPQFSNTIVGSEDFSLAAASPILDAGFPASLLGSGSSGANILGLLSLAHTSGGLLMANKRGNKQ